jgi:DNA-binding CsgD family transcriptional regulator
LALRHASDRKREKQAEVKRLAAEGLPPAEIAARVNSDPETVQRWLRPVKKLKKGK